MGVKEQPSSAVGCGANRERRGQTGSRGIRLGGECVFRGRGGKTWKGEDRRAKVSFKLIY